MDLGMMFSMGGPESVGYYDATSPAYNTGSQAALSGYDPNYYSSNDAYNDGYHDTGVGRGYGSDGNPTGDAGMGNLSGIGQALGSMAQGNAAASEANAQAAAREFEAQQAEKLASERRAEGERNRQERIRKGRIVGSTALANAAASGGGTDNAGFLDTLGDIFEEAEYQGGIERYIGEASARSATDRASAARYQASIDRLRGSNARSGAMIGAMGPLFRSFSSFG